MDKHKTTSTLQSQTQVTTQQRTEEHQTGRATMNTNREESKTTERKGREKEIMDYRFRDYKWKVRKSNQSQSQLPKNSSIEGASYGRVAMEN